MRTPIIILADVVLRGASLRSGRRLGGSMKKATIVFVPFWRVIAAGSMRVGVTRAGYSLWEESTILMLTFLLPAIVARLISWRFL